MHGDVSLLIDAAGQANASYGYTPYGETDNLSSNDTDPSDPRNPYRFNDRRYDPGSGSIDMGFRRFSPSVGRFLEQDYYRGALDDLSLALDPITQNRYSFAAGNPISFVKTDGHEPLQINFRQTAALNNLFAASDRASWGDHVASPSRCTSTGKAITGAASGNTGSLALRSVAERHT